MSANNYFELRFDVTNPRVQQPDFEVNLALRLLDIIYGRQAACYPEPAPLTNPNGNVRMIGHYNDYWLIRDEDEAGLYRVQSRYSSRLNIGKIEAAEIIVRNNYADALLPAPAQPAAMLPAGRVDELKA